MLTTCIPELGSAGEKRPHLLAVQVGEPACNAHQNVAPALIPAQAPQRACAVFKNVARQRLAQVATCHVLLTPASQSTVHYLAGLDVITNIFLALFQEDTAGPQLHWGGTDATCLAHDHNLHPKKICDSAKHLK